MHLIDKLIVNPMFVGEEKSEHLLKDMTHSGMSMIILLTDVVLFLINKCEMQLEVMTSRHTDGIRDILCKGRRYWESWHV